VDVPTYQYACTACGHQLEAVQSFADEPLTECPTCEGRLRKLFSSVGVVFKGSGFYRTDSRAAATTKEGSTSATETAAKGTPAKDSSTKDSSAKDSGASKSGDTAKKADTAKKPSAAAA
jgi:putative FmdB family regulatory protein